MQVKLTNGKHSDDIWPCDYVSVTKEIDQSDGTYIAIVVKIFRHGHKPTTISLPDDGDAIYVMNNNGDTTDSYRWPPK